MDYEKKYKEAQGWIEKIYPTLQHEQQMEAEAFFPELKESEDEKIRKEIINIFHSLADGKIPVPINYADIFTWLEKQEGCEYIKKDWLEHIKQSWYKEGFIDGKYSGGTSKEWTINDAAIFKEIIDFLENGTAKLQHDLTKYANWLKIQFTPIEKQGKQFSVDKLEPKFKVGDYVVISTTKGDKVVQIASVEYLKGGYPSYITTEGRWFGNGTKARILTDKDIETITIPERSTIVKKIKSWSEDDETKMRAALAFIKSEFPKNGDEEIMEGTIEWLKSLKQRIGWKPSDEQIKAVRLARSFVTDDFGENHTLSDVLVELEKQLKKLK